MATIGVFAFFGAATPVAALFDFMAISHQIKNINADGLKRESESVMKTNSSIKRLAFALLLICALFLVSCNFKGCTSCNSGGKIEDSNAPADTLEHVCDWQVDQILQERSCTVDGVVKYKCSCGKETTNVEKAIGHSFGDWINVCDSTCLVPGQEKRICNDCAAEELAYTEKQEHDYLVTVETINGVEKSTHLCNICGDSFTIESLLINEIADIPPQELYDCDKKFSFEIISTEDEEYIREHLSIYNAYFDGTEYENEEGVACAYSIAATATENIWEVTPVNSYTEGHTYIAERSGNVVFRDYGLEPLTFSIYKPYTNEVELSSDVVFVQELENASGGYYPFSIEFSEMSQKYWVTLGCVDGLNIGDIICVGSAISFEEVVNDGEGNYFGKIESIEKISESDLWLLSLSEPPLDELFEKLDIYSTTIADFENFESSEDLDDQMVSALYADEDFAKFLSVAYTSAQEYALERGMKAKIGTFEEFIKSITYTFTEQPSLYHSGDSALIKMKFELNGAIKIPVTISDFTDKESAVGSLDIGFKAYIHLNGFFLKLQLSLGEFSWEKWDAGEVLNFGFVEDVTAGFSINVATNVDYSLETAAYAYNIETGTYHFKNCKHVAMVKDKAKLHSVSTRTLLNLIAEGNYKTKECETCRPIQALLSTSYVINTNTNTVHTAGCKSVKTISSNNAVLSERSLSDLLSNGYNKNCKNCNPDSVNLNSFDEKIINKIKHNDFGEHVNDISKVSNSAKSEGKNRVPLGNYYFSMVGIDTEKITFYAYFEFHLDASLHYEYEIEHISVFGVRSVKNGIKPYGGIEKNETTKSELTAVGKTRIDVGIGTELSTYITGCERFINGSIDANIGIYAKVNGALHIDFIDSSEDYYAAYLESGAHCDVNIKFKIPLCEQFVKTLLDDDIPIVNMGYNKVYYNYAAIPHSINVTKTNYDLIEEGGLLDVKYYDLVGMTAGTERLSLVGDSSYEVIFSLKEGEYCSIQNGILVIKSNAPSFTDVLTVKIIGNDAWTDYGEGHNYKFMLEECRVEINYVRSQDGLEYVSNGDGTCYVSGIGTCTDSDIIIPAVSPAGEKVVKIGKRAFSNCSSVVSISIPSSVEYIGYGAFASCPGLVSIAVDRDNEAYKSVDGNLYTKDGKTLIQYAINKKDESFTIPDGVTIIGDHSFANAHNLVSVKISNGTTSIGNHAFSWCYSLTNIDIPDSVTVIDAYAFQMCKALTSITIPASVTSIGNWAFAYCGRLASITVNENNTAYKSIDGNLYTKDGKTLVRYAQGKKDTSFAIPDGVTNIGDGAFFSCHKLTSITIPDSVISISFRALEGCSSLTNVTIPVSVTSIGDNAFKLCRSLTNITYAGTTEQWNAIKKSKNLNADTEDHIVSCIDGNDVATFTQQNILQIKADSSSSYISGNWYSFKNGSSNISKAGCGIVSLVSAVYNLGGTIQKDNVGNAIDEVFDWAYKKGYWKDSVGSYWSLFTASDEKFGNIYGFNVSKQYGDRGKVNTSLDKLVEHLKSGGTAVVHVNGHFMAAVNYRLNNEKIELLIFDPAASSGSRRGTYTDKAGTWIALNILEEGSVKNYLNFKEYEKKKSQENIEIDAYWLISATSTSSTTQTTTQPSTGTSSTPSTDTSSKPSQDSKPVAKELEFTLSSDGKYYIVTGMGTYTNSNVIIPSKYKNKAVKSIGEQAFYRCTNIKSIVIPDSITSIGVGAFGGCTGLASVTIPNSVTKIGDAAFANCINLKKVDFAKSSKLGSIGNSAFARCSNLTSIIIPNGVTIIDYGAFLECKNLTSVVIPLSVQSIGIRAFEFCKNLTSIQFKGTVEQWNTITLGENWNSNVPATYVQCSNGKATSVPPLNERNWKMVDDGGINYFWGIDENGVVRDEYGNEYTMKELYKELQKTMSKDAAKNYILDLQKRLGI